jgi:hypothetical protein
MRNAHRNGLGEGMNMPLYKNENTRNADVSGVSMKAVRRFFGGSEAGVLLGQGTFGAAFGCPFGLDDWLACLRRKVLLGRNLITLFSTVNTFAKFFFGIAPQPIAGNTLASSRRHWLDVDPHA